MPLALLNKYLLLKDILTLHWRSPPSTTPRRIIHGFASDQPKVIPADRCKPLAIN